MSETDTSSPALYAAAKIIGNDCQPQNLAFIVCKKDKPNPADCVSEGEKVTACVLSTLRLLEEKCSKQFAASKVCIKDNNNQFQKCREQEDALKTCWDGLRSPSASAKSE